MTRHTYNEVDLAFVVLGSAVIALTASLSRWRKLGATHLFDLIWTPFGFLKTRLDAWIYLLWGPEMIQAGFDKAGGRPYEVLAPDNRYVFISSPEAIREMDSTPDTTLSLQAAAKQMLQPKYSMHGFNWFDRRGTEGVGFIRALRTLLTNHVPRILPNLRMALANRMANAIANRQSSNGSSRVHVYPMIVELVVLVNSLSFFGEDLAHNERFMKAALSYVEETFFIAEIVRLIPRCLHQIVGPLLARKASSQSYVYDCLMETAEERVGERDQGLKGQHNDCIQWIMETSPKQNPWSAQRIVFELMAIWFGSVHAMSTTTTFAIQDLCLHPEYIEPLREECQSAAYADFERTARGLPLLDSFIKESARLTPVESLSTRRQALKPLSLKDGTRLETGDWACTPVRALMQTPEHYPQPLEFHGFRFVEPARLVGLEDATLAKHQALQPEPSKLTDVGGSFHVWGTGRMACPGRYYAAAIMKVLVAQVVLRYDIQLVAPTARRWWTWRSSMLPRADTEVAFTPRE